MLNTKISFEVSRSLVFFSSSIYSIKLGIFQQSVRVLKKNSKKMFGFDCSPWSHLLFIALLWSDLLFGGSSCFVSTAAWSAFCLPLLFQLSFGAVFRSAPNLQIQSSSVHVKKFFCRVRQSSDHVIMNDLPVTIVWLTEVSCLIRLFDSDFIS